jgi:hypothetical protein
MPKILYPPASYWGPQSGKIEYDNPRNQPLHFLDYDGVWCSDDPRILEFCGIGWPGPEAIVYGIPGGPPKDLHVLTSDFIATQTEVTSSRFPNKYHPKLIKQLVARHPDYLEALRSPLDLFLECKFDTLSHLAESISVETMPREADVVPHLDSSPNNRSEFNTWTYFAMLDGDIGSIVHTRTHRLVQLQAGELATWRSTSSWHSAPPPPYQRMIFKRFGYEPLRPLPAAVIHIPGQPYIRTPGP